ncbi:hypothetical protein MD484_g5227, partial [Candolleomyces efflorescens]
MAGPSNSGHPARSSSAISTHTSTPLHGAPSNDRALPPLFAQSLRPTRVPTPEHPPQVEEVHDQHETSPETPSAESQTNTASSSNGAPLASSDLIAITNTLRTLAHGLERVSEAMEKQHTLLASKIDALQTSSGPASRSPRSTATRRSRDHPYQRTEPEKRKQSHKLLSSSIRKHLDKLLDAHDDPFVSPEQSASFDLLVKKDPARRCCDVAHFQIDLQHGPHSPWNVSAALVFAEDYMQAHQPMDRIDDVTHAFFTRVKSIKQFLNERPDRREAKTQYGRKYGLFYRRLEAVLAFPDSKIHQDIVKMLGVDAFTFDPPNEILLEIFKHYVDPANRAQKESLRTECQHFFSLFLVRSSWRAVLQGCPEFLGRVIDWDQDHPTKIERFLELSSPAPITIVTGFRQARNASPQTQRELQKNYELALDHFKRCDYLYMTVGVNHFKHRRRFLDILAGPGVGDNLKHFTLLWESHGTTGLLVNAAFPSGLNQLATFQMSGPLAYDPRYLPFSQGTMPRCTAVTILGDRRPHEMQESEFYPRVWARRLACVPHLTHLTLCHVLIAGDSAASLSAQNPVALSQLSRLVLAGHLSTCSHLLRLLDIPRTCRLVASCVIDADWGWGLSEFDDAWDPFVQKIPVLPTIDYKRWTVGFGTELMFQGQDSELAIIFKVVIVYVRPGMNAARDPTFDFFDLWASALHKFQSHPSSPSLLRSADTLCLKSEDIPQNRNPPMMRDKYYVSFFEFFTGVRELWLSSFSPLLWRILSLHSHVRSANSPPQGILPNLSTVKLLGRGFTPSLASRGAKSMYRCVLHFLLERQADRSLQNIQRIFVVGDEGLELDDFRVERSLSMGEGLGMVACELNGEVRASRYLDCDEGWAWAKMQGDYHFHKYLRTSY